jgi:ubiquitin carboxyl-terminal hydrolase 16/45
MGAAVVVHLGATAITGHYVCYVLIDPGMIIKTRPSLSSAPIQTESEACEPDMHAEAMAAPVDKAEVSGNTVDQRVWCYCSELVDCCFLRPNPRDLMRIVRNHSTQVRLASLEEVLKAKAYMCFVSSFIKISILLYLLTTPIHVTV